MSAPNFNPPSSPFPKWIFDLRHHFSPFALFRLLIFQLARSQQLFVTQRQTYTTKLRFWKQLYLNYKSKKHLTPGRFVTNKINQQRNSKRDQPALQNSPSIYFLCRFSSSKFRLHCSSKWRRRSAISWFNRSHFRLVMCIVWFCSSLTALASLSWKQIQ